MSPPHKIFLLYCYIFNSYSKVFIFLKIIPDDTAKCVPDTVEEIAFSVVTPFSQ